MLDAGCGTGLCGPLVAPYARRLVGVDLSEGMLKQAAEKNVYDALVKAELTEYLGDHRDAFDLIVSADTLVYFGDLAGVLAAAARAAAGRAVRLHARARGRRDRRYRLPAGTARPLQPRPAHVERLLIAAGLQPAIAHAELRMEAGVPVAGLVVRAGKAAASQAPQ